MLDAPQQANGADVPCAGGAPRSGGILGAAPGGGRGSQAGPRLIGEPLCGVGRAMKLYIDSLWSPDLDPPSSGLPHHLQSFDLLVQVALSERGQRGREVFSLRVCTPERLAAAEPGQFVSHVLVLRQFSWSSVTERLERLLRHTESCSTWGECIAALSPYLRYSH